MRLPTFKPNDIDYARLMREWELLDGRNKVLERENAALQNEVDELKRLNELTKVLTKDLQDTRRENTALKQTLIEVTTELTAIKCKK